MSLQKIYLFLFFYYTELILQFKYDIFTDELFEIIVYLLVLILVDALYGFLDFKLIF